MDRREIGLIRALITGSALDQAACWLPESSSSERMNRLRWADSLPDKSLAFEGSTGLRSGLSKPIKRGWIPLLLIGVSSY